MVRPDEKPRNQPSLFEVVVPVLPATGRPIDQPVIEVCGVEQTHRLGVVTDLRPAHRLPQFVHRPGAAGQGDEAVGDIGERLFALVHRAHDVKLGAAAMRDLGIDQRLRDHADHLAARLQRRVGNRAHQPQPPAAIDHPDPALGEGTADETGILDIDGIARGGRAAIDGETVEGRHGCSSISAAVALALPITPGMPAPGCVPAPTK